MGNGVSNARSRYSQRAALLLVAAVLVAVPFFTLLFQVVAEGPLTRLDGRLADRLNDAVHANAVALAVLRVVTVFGSTPVLALVVIAAVWFVVSRGRHRLGTFLVVTTVGGALLNSVVKLAVARPRPVVDHVVATAFGKSFPSGHAMSSTVVYGAVLVALLPMVPPRRRRFVVAAAVVVVLAVGTSRLLLGVHFLSDVVGGYVLGLAWLVGSVALFEAWRTEEGRRASNPVTEGVEPEAGPALRGD
ncbi:MAG TPA: phosphatase PAP2 family protein [Acidimicrobiales bacterium]|nr:phosphatase PAP2 family protein [Acidimicrobiales bacterium]